ncbi:putative S-adenosyl-L-methionine-dependent methyltransferase [Rosa chinensis]|uniref:Putative S-adenosyl-L-methionine-dependent methyltransferase n=1 Tax=Rosa chinensis TaxID=74649 RepID=A0A2P6SC59_ROSCH|nr:putative S-adenosyl-L-methionine-dependent methyltransferase [Rosa chinensis]
MKEVLRVCRQYFGPADGEHINVCVRDALKVIDRKHFLLSIR